MKYFVTVSFDLKDPDPEDYERVSSRLKGAGFKDKVQEDNRQENLPTTTFVGSRTADSLTGLQNSTRERVKKIFKDLNVQGRIFITVAKDTESTWALEGIL